MSQRRSARHSGTSGGGGVARGLSVSATCKRLSTSRDHSSVALLTPRFERMQWRKWDRLSAPRDWRDMAMTKQHNNRTDWKTRGMRLVPNAAAVLTVPALVAVLAGCIPIAAPTTTATPDAAPTESESATPAPVVEPLNIPGCETLLPIAVAQSSFAESTAFLGENVPTEYYPWYQLPPVLAAISGVTVARRVGGAFLTPTARLACWWPKSTRPRERPSKQRSQPRDSPP